MGDTRSLSEPDWLEGFRFLGNYERARVGRGTAGRDGDTPHAREASGQGISSQSRE